MIKVKDCHVILEKLNMAEYQQVLLNNNNKRVGCEESELCFNSSEFRDENGYMVKIHDNCLENLASVKKIKLEPHDGEEEGFSSLEFNILYEGLSVVKQEPECAGFHKDQAVETIPVDQIKLELTASEEHKGFESPACGNTDTNKPDDESLEKLKKEDVRKSFPCPVCRMSFEKLGSLKQHSSSQLCMTGFQCYYCAFKFRIKHEIRTHIAIRHFGKEPIRCGECKYRCTSARRLRQHRLHAHKPVKFTCPHCGINFAKETSFKNHLLKEEAKVFRCALCGASFALKSQLNYHVSKEHKAFQCMLCDVRMSEKSKLHNHMRTVHNGEKRFACTVCDHVTTQRTHLKTHMDHVHNGVKRFQCFHCDKRFAEKKNMESHITSVHLKLRPFACRHCPSKFTQKSHLNTHMKKIHLQFFKAYKCSLCDTAFGERGNLKKHMDTVHLKLRPHECGHCLATFGQRSSLLQHIRTLHSDDRVEYRCSHCDYKTTSQAGLINHVKRRHSKTQHTPDQHSKTSVRLFKCAHCKFRCALQVNFQIHNDIFHGDKKKIKIKKIKDTE